ncbi:hypothetical protein CEXT_802021, partial [Caerostris extrusa]
PRGPMMESVDEERRFWASSFLLHQGPWIARARLSESEPRYHGYEGVSVL